MNEDIKLDYSSDCCFVCGKKNPKGLKLDFNYDKKAETVSASIIFKDYMQGYSNIVHGGFISMLLDEVMAKACVYNGYNALTGRLEVKFIKPVYVNKRVNFFARVDKVKNKIIWLSSWCSNNTGEILAKANGVFKAIG